MEDLNKNQFILLVLLITFVTSIATGIMTSSLLQEAPIEVTRNINRIVEKTIETVVPATNDTPTTKEVTTVTTIVKEEDLIIDAIDKNIKSIVRIREKDGVSGTTSFYGIGVVVTKGGLIGADRKTIIAGNTYTATLNDGTTLTLSPTGVDKQTNFILFKPVGAKATSTAFVSATLSDSDAKLGQTLISLGGDTDNAVSVGRVVSIDMKDSGTGTSTVKSISKINTDVLTKDLVNGSPIFNLSGDIIGIRLGSDELRSFTPIVMMKKELASLIELTKEAPKNQ